MDGERLVTEVLREATARGLAAITLRRVRKALGVQVRREGFGKEGRFLLALPSNGSDAAEGARDPNGEIRMRPSFIERCSVTLRFEVTMC